MQRLTRDRIRYAFDRRIEPALRVASGETFVVETEDSRTGQTRTPATITPEYVKSLRTKGPYYGNPVTGPIFVEGAEPGDTLAVTIRSMQCDTLGYFGYWPVLYHMQDWFDEPVTQLVDIRDGYVHYTMQTAQGPHAVQVPVRPMIGCIGTAPDLEVISAGHAGRHGGNLDTPEVCPGSTVYLPIAAPGALLFLGDCHPYQGDGEVSGCEMRSVVTLACEVLKGWTRNQAWLRIETAESLVTVAADRPAESAQWLALREMILWLQERHGWTRDEARMFLALAGDLRPGQMQVAEYTMRYIVPKAQLPRAAN